MIYSTKCIVHYIYSTWADLFVSLSLHFQQNTCILNNKQMEVTIQTVVCQSHLTKTDLSSN